jgi:hypothetical protein
MLECMRRDSSTDTTYQEQAVEEDPEAGTGLNHAVASTASHVGEGNRVVASSTTTVTEQEPPAISV